MEDYKKKNPRVVYLHHNRERETGKYWFTQGEPRRVFKFGRNAPCPCGSGKKYKRCHGVVKYPDPQPKGLENE